MPTYDYKCKSCLAIQTMFKTIATRDETSTDTCSNCHEINTLQRMVSAPLVGYHTYVGSAGKPPEGFRNVLKEMHKNTYGSKLDQSGHF